MRVHLSNDIDNDQTSFRADNHTAIGVDGKYDRHNSYSLNVRVRIKAET